MAFALLEPSDIEQIIESANEKFADKILTKIYNPTPEIMTIEQVCKYTQYSRPTILKFIREQGFPVSRPCESMRFFKSDVDEWMKAKL